MKNTWKTISIISITLFAILWISGKFFESEYNMIEFRNLLVVIYLFASLKYYQLELKSKDAIIASLQSKLEKK